MAGKTTRDEYTTRPLAVTASLGHLLGHFIQC